MDSLTTVAKAKMWDAGIGRGANQSPDEHRVLSREGSHTSRLIAQTCLYTCRVDVIDDMAGRFAFPRFQLYVRR